MSSGSSEVKYISSPVTGCTNPNVIACKACRGQVSKQLFTNCSDIFAAEGEDGFRAKESAQTARFAKEGRQLLSCGGGIIKRGENLRALHQNGVVLFLDRPLDALTVGGGRPLSSSTEALKKMEAERRPLYLAAADAVIPNSGTVEDAVTAAMEALDEIFSH